MTTQPLPRKRPRTSRPDTDAATVRWTGGALDARPVVTPPPRLRHDSRGKILPLPLDDHTHCAMMEDVLWLCSPVGGALTFGEACQRLGLDDLAVEKQFRRWRVPVPLRYRRTADGEPYSNGALTTLERYRLARREEAARGRD
jgi:hypothetical protein